MRDAMRRAGTRLRRRLRTAERADEEHRETALHDVRKAAKRVRYTAEVAAPQAGTSGTGLVRITKKVQKVLGHLQDTVVTREQCRQLGLAAFAAGENPFTYGLLLGLEDARADRARASFAAMEPGLVPALRAAART
jgi:CHAD domain-containing protein